MFADTPPCFLSPNMSNTITNPGIFYPYIVGDCWSQSISDIPMTSSSNSLFHNTSNTIVLKTNNVYILYIFFIKKKTITPPHAVVFCKFMVRHESWDCRSSGMGLWQWGFCAMVESWILEPYWGMVINPLISINRG